MIEPTLPILPDAIYFDTNAFVAAPQTLEAQPIAEMSELAERLGAGMFVPQLVADEWLAHCCSNAIETMKRIENGMKTIEKMIDHNPVQIESLSREELCEKVERVQTRRLSDLGFQLIPTPNVDLQQLLTLFVEKVPPFSDGDKGFKDAVILETIIEHACEVNRFAHILIVSGDKVFSHDAIKDKFAEAGTTIHVVGGNARELFTKSVDRMKLMLTDAVKVLVKREEDAAVSFARQHEAEILAFVREKSSISMSLVRGTGLSHILREKDADDKRLEYAQIVSIDAIRPLRVESAFVHKLRERDDGRQSLLITVELNIDLTISATNYFVEPQVPIDRAPALLEEHSRWRYPQSQESITVKREIHVSASVAAEKDESGEFTDLQLESAG